MTTKKYVTYRLRSSSERKSEREKRVTKEESLARKRSARKGKRAEQE